MHNKVTYKEMLFEFIGRIAEELKRIQLAGVTDALLWLHTGDCQKIYGVDTRSYRPEKAGPATLRQYMSKYRSELVREFGLHWDGTHTPPNYLAFTRSAKLGTDWHRGRAARKLRSEQKQLEKLRGIVPDHLIDEAKQGISKGLLSSGDGEE